MIPRSKISRLLNDVDLSALDERLKDQRLSFREIAEWVRSLGYSVTPNDVQVYSAKSNARPVKRRRRNSIDKALSPEHQKEYEAFLADPKTTREGARAWLRERGYPDGQYAVTSHRNKFLDRLDQVEDTARFAAAVCKVAEEYGPVDMSKAMLLRFEQVVLEQLSKALPDQQIEPKDLAELSKSVAGALGSRERFGEIQREFDQEKRRATQAAEDAVKQGATGQEVVDRVKEILGV